MTILVTCQLIVTLDSIRNSCDVLMNTYVPKTADHQTGRKGPNVLPSPPSSVSVMAPSFVAAPPPKPVLNTDK